ncbi:MAG: RluA family pseudouridine synthase [Pseudomonadota bacterium]|nr:RluA family pseudouridine synthase [Pseudomonadota bacterium]
MLEVSAEDADIRVDRWFRRHFPDLKHGRLEKLLRTGQVRVDGGRAKASTRLEAGQLLRVPPLFIEAGDRPVTRSRNVSEKDRAWIRSLVIHSDDDLIVINKPSGIAVQGGTGIIRHIDGLLSGLVPHGAECPKLVHRLDRDTSGVLVIARRAAVAAMLGDAFRGRDAVKEYWALVAGVPLPRQGAINQALIKSSGKEGYEKVVVNASMGKPAKTEYRVIEAAGRKVAWLLLKPRTGRTHQLRVHCAGMGTPIAGDFKYGGKQAILDGIASPNSLHLHAQSIVLPHPSGGKLGVTAPLPEKLQKSWEFFGFDTRRQEVL